MADCKFSSEQICLRKVSFTTSNKAKRKVRELRGLGRNVVKYRCGLCHNWHIGGKKLRSERDKVIKVTRNVNFIEILREVASEYKSIIQPG